MNKKTHKSKHRRKYKNYVKSVSPEVLKNLYVEEYYKELEKYLAKYHNSILIPIAEETFYICKAKTRFERLCKQVFTIDDFDMLLRCHNKYKFQKLLEIIGGNKGGEEEEGRGATSSSPARPRPRPALPRRPTTTPSSGRWPRSGKCPPPSGSPRDHYCSALGKKGSPEIASSAAAGWSGCPWTPRPLCRACQTSDAASRSYSRASMPGMVRPMHRRLVLQRVDFQTRVLIQG